MSCVRNIIFSVFVGSMKFDNVMELVSSLTLSKVFNHFSLLSLVNPFLRTRYVKPLPCLFRLHDKVLYLCTAPLLFISFLYISLTHNVILHCLIILLSHMVYYYISNKTVPFSLLTD